MDTEPFLAYIDGRQARWRLTLDQCIEEAGDDPRARLLAVFDALRAWADSQPGFRSFSFTHAMVELAGPQHPARTVLTANKQALRRQMLELAEATGTPDPGLLTDQLLLIYEGAIANHALGTVDRPADRAHATARQIIAAASPLPLHTFLAN
ncbi:TetR/AcrR family transcriptional regulator [Streptomyces sp. NPDC014734]|uniref:TetR/AcrR family transcriptional regulator n=1 Tax=Streptomyces sp. NPDC014734 TaxID=3364886 RepID=UPI0036FC96E1